MNGIFQCQDEANILPKQENLTGVLSETLERIFHNYESEWNDYEEFRKLYRDSLSHESLVNEAKSFIYQIHHNDYHIDLKRS